ncbi:MAG TPA: sulfurtransferase [Steroidobacteraceae bacterium]
MYTTLIEAAPLAAMLQDPDVVILDCRFDLMRPEWGRQAYEAGHIPGALYAHLDEDLSGTVTPQTGRHPLPSRERFAETLGRWGIDSRVQVVAYDQANSAFAARLWWMLRWMGHEAVAVLNGGFAAWQAAGLPVVRESSPRAARQFVPREPLTDVVTTAQLEQALARGDSLLVDARAADRFAGQNETIDPVAGHIPGACNHPFSANLQPDGKFLSAQELRRRWEATLQGRPAAQVISMCGSGVTACHNLLALEIAGLAGAQLYGGSWSEWIRDPARPVARGPA